MATPTSQCPRVSNLNLRRAHIYISRGFSHYPSIAVCSAAACFWYRSVPELLMIVASTILPAHCTIIFALQSSIVKNVAANLGAEATPRLRPRPLPSVSSLFRLLAAHASVGLLFGLDVKHDRACNCRRCTIHSTHQVLTACRGNFTDLGIKVQCKFVLICPCLHANAAWCAVAGRFYG